MKQIIALALFCFLAIPAVIAQKDEARKSPHETVTAKNVTITYGRPYKKGREIFGALEPYGKDWRAGADEATPIKLDKACFFNGKQLNPGTYTLFAIPEKDHWTIILNSELNQWGAYSYDKNKKSDVLKTDVPVKMNGASVEQFTISPTETGFTMSWDKTSVFVPIKFF